MASNNSLRVMTYNIRFDTAQDGHNQWRNRKDRVIQLIEKYKPDLFGVQEAVVQQMNDLQTGLIDYRAYGVGRDDGRTHGEFSPVFYRHDRFELKDQRTFWLSETPDKPGSKGWDAVLPRICSWVRLKDRLSDKELCFFNTHFDHIGRNARQQSANLILTRIQQIAGQQTPVILTGDFNTGPQSAAYQTVVTDTIMQDAKSITESEHQGPDGTWSTFDVQCKIGDRIDYIFIKIGHFIVSKHEHLTDSDGKHYPSDHLPVRAELNYTN